MADEYYEQLRGHRHKILNCKSGIGGWNDDGHVNRYKVCCFVDVKKGTALRYRMIEVHTLHMASN